LRNPKTLLKYFFKISIHALILVICSLLFSWISVVSAESKVTYIFRGGQPIDLVFEQTLDVLRTNNFGIHRLNQSEGIIETEYELIVRKVWYDFRVKYEIQIWEYGGRTRMDVVAMIFEAQWRGGTGEIKTAWWLVKQVVRRIGK
jgi:hypothetical protein